MTFSEHEINGTKIGEVVATELVINTIEDGVDLLGNLYYSGFDKVILHQKNITPQFFDLKTGMAGEILQKFSNYRIPLIIVGDFSENSSNSLKDFIYECNSGKQLNFFSTLEEALEKLANP